ncbi:hypothetical protein ACET3Z_010327 [Daucus carota]
MVRKACFHCGIDETGIWRTGPAEKPVLCNACGTRWRVQGTLADYIPRHGSAKIHEPSTAEKPDLLSFKAPRRKRSVLPQYCLTSVGRLHRQLLQIQHEQEGAELKEDDEDDCLIDNKNVMSFY